MTNSFWDRLWSLALNEDLPRQLRVRSVSRSFSHVLAGPTKNLINWRLALFIASAIDESAPDRLLELRLQICLEALQALEASEAVHAAAATLLQRSGNERAVELAVTRQLIPAANASLPMSTVGLEAVRASLANTIPTSHGTVIRANDFQSAFWDAAATSAWLSASAPTSAGKSFIVREFIRDQLADNINLQVALIVPTRALVEEVSRDLQHTLTPNVSIITLPWTHVASNSGRVFVMTQERFHALQQLHPDLTVDLLFVDEAQNMADGRRGVLLRRVLEEAKRRNDGVRVIFASPTTGNPEVLLSGAPEGSAPIRTRASAVGQNLIFVNQVPYHPRRWLVKSWSDHEHIEVGELELSTRPTGISKRLPLIAAAMGNASSSNIVYADGPAEAEKIALQLADALGPPPEIPQELLDLEELSEKAIHPEYALGDTIRRGVAFHYGNMPVVVREAIEEAFRNGFIRFLVCTSTLLEGVNLPCQNIFVRGPHKGPSNAMVEADFWNLAGRAGRWGKEFQGNIICVDTERPNVWEHVPGEKKLQTITLATDRVRSDLPQFEVAISGNQVETSETLESIVSLALAARSVGTKIEDAAWLGLDSSERAKVGRLLDERLGGLQIPALLVRRHAGISPRRLENLLLALSQRSDIESLDLLLPESAEASRRLAVALGIVGAFLGGTIGSNVGRQTQLAIMLVQWMRGVPLAALISSRVNFVRRRDGVQANVPSTIRSVMKDVEQVARFEAPLLLGAYRDVLAVARTGEPLEATGSNSDDFVAMLELGVSRMTEFSMLSVGLSRTAAVALSEYISADNLTPDDVDAWLADRNLDALALPALIRLELHRYRDSKSAY